MLISIRGTYNQGKHTLTRHGSPMAELLVSASTGAMGSLLMKLGTMLSDEYKLLKNVREDIRFLKDELEAMHAFLIFMANVERPDEPAKLRVNVVREMSYEIEDIIDKFMIQVEREPTTKSDGFIKIIDKSMKKIRDIKIHHEIAKDIKDIKNQVKEISERYARYKIDESSRTRNEKVDPRLCAIFKDVSYLVGIDGPRDELIKLLSNKESELGHQPKVLSIVGYGGLGKTTLAKQIYDKIKAQYECGAFVSISRSPDMTQILSSILCQLRNQDYAHAGPEPRFIINQIRDFLKNRRYFVIIDDIWDIQTWQTLDCALFKNGCGSVIMTTTRIHDVAKSCCSQEDLVYKIQPLNVPDSKRLFFKRIFGCEEKCPSNLKEMAEDVLKKCGGLPLAINAISSLLATGKTKEEWGRVRSSIKFARGRNSHIDAMDYILSLSYFDLPLHLRSCLLYLTMFPEDYEIESRWVVPSWISEGFVYDENGGDLVELGHTYFHELVNRSSIQPVNISADGKAWSCRVHDTVLDFLIYKSNEENFCTLLSRPLKPGSRVRRLSLMGNEDQGIIEQLNLSHARSLIAFPKVKFFPSLAKSNALRVLDLKDCSNLENHHVKDIGRLFQLRYLNVYWTYITKLPSKIGELLYLETLGAHQTKLVELPESITMLRQLACLNVSAETKFPDGIGSMKKLQELGRINPLKQSLKFVEELGKLTNLKELDIEWDPSQSSGNLSFKEENMVLFFSSLRRLEMCKLTSITVILSLTEEMHAFLPALTSIRVIGLNSGKLRWISKWLVSLVNLEELDTIGKAEVERHDIEIVRSIPTLLHLGLRCTISEPIIISSGGFQRLCSLWFYVRNDLVFEKGAMPNLKDLSLRIKLHKFKLARGGRAGGFDFGIRHLSKLYTVYVQLTCSDVSTSDVEAAEDAFKKLVNAHPNHPTLEMARYYPDKTGTWKPTEVVYIPGRYYEHGIDGTS